MSSRTCAEPRTAGLVVSQWPADGPAVLGLAGLGSSGRSFAHLASALPDRHLVAPHLRGRGGSVGAEGPTGLRAHARDVARVLEDLDLTDVVVVGHSMGAYLAPLVAQEAAGRITRLVLVDGGLPPAFPFFLGPRLTRLAFRRELRDLDRDWASVDAVADHKLPPLVRDRPELRPLLVEALAADLDGPPGAVRPLLDAERCVADAVDAFFGPDTTPALEALSVPAHLLAATSGKADGVKPFLSDAVLAAWTARLPLLTAERVQANHVTLLLADEVVAAVRG